MTSETKPLTGLELRKAGLIAAGWSVRKSDLGFEGAREAYVLHMPDGTMYDNPNNRPFMTFEWDSWRIWEHAPAVESSVDAALEYLLLSENCGWVISTPPFPDELKGQVTIKDYHTRQTYSTLFYKNLSEAMCQAWLQWKTA